MARSPARKPLQQIPRGRVRLAGFAWLLLAMGLLPLGGFAMQGAWQKQVPSQHEFLGSLRSTATPLSISLPAVSAVSEVLVATGDVVRSGQTLVSLDAVAMQREHEAIEHQKKLDQNLLRCLFKLSNDHENMVEIATKAPLPERCSDLRARERSIRDNFTATRDASLAQISLIDTYLATATQIQRSAENSDQAQAVLDRILGLSLTKASLEKNLNRARLEHQAMRAAIYAERAKLVTETQAGLRLREQELVSLSALINDPRIHAPFSGKVIRVRRIPTGAPSEDPSELIALLPQRVAGYSITFDLSSQRAEAVRIGDTMRLTVIGLPLLKSSLQASVTRISETGGGLTVHADLTSASTQQLAASPYSRQILANSSAVSVRLTGAPVALSERSLGIVQNDIVVSPSPALKAVISASLWLRQLPLRLRQAAFFDRL